MLIPIVWAAAFILFWCVGLGAAVFTNGMAMVLLAGFTVYGLLRLPVQKPPHFFYAWMLFGWLGLLLAAFLWTPHLNSLALNRVSGIIVLTVALAFLLIHAPQAKRTYDIVSAYCYACVLWAIWLCVQFFCLPQGYADSAFHPGLGGQIPATILLVGFILYLPHSTRHKFNLVLLGILFAGILATNVQMPLFGAVIAAGIYAAYEFKNLKWRVLLPFIVCVSVYGITQIGAPANVATEIGRIATQSLPVRQILWHSAWDMIQAAPIEGHGIGRFTKAYGAFRDINDPESGLSPHNDFLNLWVEFGFSAVVFYVVAICALIHLMVRQGVALMPLLALGAVFVISCFNPVLHDMGVLMAVALCTHALTFNSLQQQTVGEVKHMPDLVRQGLADIILIICFGLTFLQIQIEFAMDDFMAAFKKGSVKEASIALDRADYWNLHLNASAPTVRASIANELLRARPNDTTLQNIAETQALQALRLEPAQADAAFQLALLAATRDDRVTQYGWLSYAVKADPAYVDARLNLAKWYFDAKLYNRAYLTLRDGRFNKSWTYDRAPLIKFLIIESWARGDVTALKDALWNMAGVVQASHINRFRKQLVIAP